MRSGSLDRREFLSGRIAPLVSRVAAVGELCFARNGIVCQTCGDVCQEAAIRFHPRIGGPALPDLCPDRCTSCGACVGACPAEAIRLVLRGNENDVG